MYVCIISTYTYIYMYAFLMYYLICTGFDSNNVIILDVSY